MRKGKRKLIKRLPLKLRRSARRAQRCDSAGSGAVSWTRAGPLQWRPELRRRCQCCWRGPCTEARGAPPSTAERWPSSPCRRSCGRSGWSPAPWCCVLRFQEQLGGFGSEPGSGLAHWAHEPWPHCLPLWKQIQTVGVSYRNVQHRKISNHQLALNICHENVYVY